VPRALNQSEDDDNGMGFHSNLRFCPPPPAENSTCRFAVLECYVHAAVARRIFAALLWRVKIYNKKSHCSVLKNIVSYEVWAPCSVSALGCKIQIHRMTYIVLLYKTVQGRWQNHWNESVEVRKCFKRHFKAEASFSYLLYYYYYYY